MENDIKLIKLIGSPDMALNSVLEATTVGNGASKIGINDAGDYYSSTTVEGALQEAATNTIKAGGGLVLSTKTVTTTYQILRTDFVVRINSASNVDITLPSAITGQVLWICNIGSSAITLMPSVGDNIASLSELGIDAGGLIILQCTAANTWNSIVG